MPLAFTNGCFDILHKGHLDLLAECRRLAGKRGKVVVAIDTDERVAQLKGPGRPIIPLDDRISMLLAIRYVDAVMTFASDQELLDCATQWKPAYWVKGPPDKHCKVKAKLLRKWGGEYVCMAGKHDSTTAILGRLQAAQG